MGNTTTKEQPQEPKEEIKVSHVIKDESQRKLHSLLRVVDSDHYCSCGLIVQDKHIYNLHVEQYEYIVPKDNSGWPARHFETIPYVELSQRLIVSKGNINYGLFTSVNLREKFDNATVRKAISSIPGWNKEIGDLDKTACLVSAIGINYKTWRRWDKKPPKELKTFSEIRSKATNEILFPSTGEDILLFVKANRMDMCHELTKRFITALGDNVKSANQTPTFRHAYGVTNDRMDYAKDLTGFIDGTRNPDHLLRAIVDEAIIFPDDEAGDYAHTGGSYMYAGRFVHDLPKFFKLKDEEKSSLIGRDYTNMSPHVGYDKRPENPHLEPLPSDSHVARAHGAMQRHAMPYRNLDEEGLYFIAFSRSLEELDKALNRMAGHQASDGSPDRLLSITKAVTSNYYYTPSLKELELLSQIESGKEEEEQKEEQKEELKEEQKEEIKDKIEIYIEYCTNCGYKTIYNEKRDLLKKVSNRIVVIGNNGFPRLSAFEVTLADGTVLWSKLDHPSGDGRNNYPHVFPTNEQILEAVEKHLGLKYEGEIPQSLIYQEACTRRGIW